MTKLIIATASTAALLSLVACSDSGSKPETQATTPPATTETQPAPATPEAAPAKPAEPAAPAQ